MKKDDYGFYGKGIDGYVHYKQAFDEMHKSPASHSSHRINPRHSYTSGDSWDTLFSRSVKQLDGAQVFGSVEEFLGFAEKAEGKVFVIGGGLALIIYFLYLVYCV